MPIVYKVVRKRGDDLVSAICRERAYGGIFLDEKVSVIAYAPQKETKPLFGRLFAFRRKSDAVSFARLVFNAEIWRATAPDTRKVIDIAGDGLSSSEKDMFQSLANKFLSFWSGKLIGFGKMEAPLGTVVCSSITLLKKVS